MQQRARSKPPVVVVLSSGFRSEFFLLREVHGLVLQLANALSVEEPLRLREELVEGLTPVVCAGLWPSSNGGVQFLQLVPKNRIITSFLMAPYILHSTEIVWNGPQNHLGLLVVILLLVGERPMAAFEERAVRSMDRIPASAHTSSLVELLLHPLDYCQPRFLPCFLVAFPRSLFLLVEGVGWFHSVFDDSSLETVRSEVLLLFIAWTEPVKIVFFALWSLTRYRCQTNILIMRVDPERLLAPWPVGVYLVVVLCMDCLVGTLVVEVIELLDFLISSGFLSGSKFFLLSLSLLGIFLFYYLLRSLLRRFSVLR